MDNSLRDLYAKLSTFKKVDGKLSKEDLEEKRRINKILEHPICPNCLKSVAISDLAFKCPFCDKPYGFKGMIDGEGDFLKSLLSFGINKIDIGMKKTALYDVCFHCHREIPSFDCVHCGYEIDVFAEYDYDQLNGRSRE